MSWYSIIRMTPCPGPGTAERNMRTDFGMTGLLNFGSAACASFFRKSGRRSGLMSYLKMAITDMGFSHVSCEAAAAAMRMHHCVQSSLMRDLLPRGRGEKRRARQLARRRG